MNLPSYHSWKATSSVPSVLWLLCPTHHRPIYPALDASLIHLQPLLRPLQSQPHHWQSVLWCTHSSAHSRPPRESKWSTVVFQCKPFYGFQNRYLQGSLMSLMVLDHSLLYFIYFPSDCFTSWHINPSPLPLAFAHAVPSWNALLPSLDILCLSLDINLIVIFLRGFS